MKSGADCSTPDRLALACYAATRPGTPGLASPSLACRAWPCPDLRCQTLPGRAVPAVFRTLSGDPSLINNREDLSQFDQLCVTLPPCFQFAPCRVEYLLAKLGVAEGMGG